MRQSCRGHLPLRTHDVRSFVIGVKEYRIHQDRDIVSLNEKRCMPNKMDFHPRASLMMCSRFRLRTSCNPVAFARMGEQPGEESQLCAALACGETAPGRTACVISGLF